MVNINNVYQTVLVIANKDNRGYITPEEFNRLADQSQNEIFEAYFMKQASYEGGVEIQSDFSDPELNGSEKINEFYKNSSLTKAGNIFTYPTDIRSLGVVNVNEIVADKASHEEIKYINLSPLTYPVAKQPVYTLSSTGVRVYPDTITTGVSIDYLKNPVRPKWGYVMPTAAQIAAGVPNEPIYDPTVFDPAVDSYDTPAKSFNFELHDSEFNELVVTILSYAGVVIKQPDVTQFATSKEVQFQQTEQ
tara:strand:- start:192 stop:935 length:744 start_codon:yes stop_codon:yes gene_type:complete